MSWGHHAFITLLGGAAVAWPLAARAQQTDAGRQVRIGVVALVPPTPAMMKAFRDGMRDRGYIEGQNLTIDIRWPRETFDQNPGVVTDLVKSNVDVIVAWATPTVIALRRATSAIPIVMVSVGDPVGSGFVASLARPGGNITGVSIITSDLSAKLLGLFARIIPSMRRIGLVSNPSIRTWRYSFGRARTPLVNWASNRRLSTPEPPRSLDADLQV